MNTNTLLLGLMVLVTVCASAADAYESSNVNLRRLAPPTPICGDGKLQRGEECEEDADCSSGSSSCIDCVCSTGSTQATSTGVTTTPNGGDGVCSDGTTPCDNSNPCTDVCKCR